MTDQNVNYTNMGEHASLDPELRKEFQKSIHDFRLDIGGSHPVPLLQTNGEVILERHRVEIEELKQRVAALEYLVKRNLDNRILDSHFLNFAGAMTEIQKGKRVSRKIWQMKGGYHTILEFSDLILNYDGEPIALSMEDYTAIDWIVVE